MRRDGHQFVDLFGTRQWSDQSNVDPFGRAARVIVKVDTGRKVSSTL